MVSLYQYEFTDVNANHTISAEFEEEIIPPTPTTSNVLIYIKENNQWVPLFTS